MFPLLFFKFHNQEKFKRASLWISSSIALCSSPFSIILSFELLTFLASMFPSFNFFTLGDHQATLASPNLGNHHTPLASSSLSHDLEIPPGGKLGRCRLTLFACPFSKFTVLYCLFFNVKSIVLYILLDFFSCINRRVNLVPGTQSLGQ